MYVVVVEFVASPGNESEFRSRVMKQAHDSLEKEARCHVFDVSVDPDDPARFYLYEVYDDEAAFNLHLESEHFRAFSDATAPWVTSKTVRIFHRL